MKRSFLPLGLLLSLFLLSPGLSIAAPELSRPSDEESWQGYRLWKWQFSDCSSCKLRIRILHPDLRDDRVLDFIRVIEDRREELLQLYGSDPQEYNLLAHMAVGILGRESRFFRSQRYLMKESFPELVVILKILQIYLDDRKVLDPKTKERVYASPGLSSRGPTQIKMIPKKIAKKYGITVETLHRPDHAALATMGYLIEALAELKRRIVLNRLDFVKPDNYVDYLPYIYFGSRQRLIRGQAKPHENPYIVAMKEYMTWVEIYETSPDALESHLQGGLALP